MLLIELGNVLVRVEQSEQLRAEVNNPSSSEAGRADGRRAYDKGAAAAQAVAMTTEKLGRCARACPQRPRRLPAVVSTTTPQLATCNIVTVPPVPCTCSSWFRNVTECNVSARMSRSKTATIHSGIPVPKTYRMCRKWVPLALVLVELILFRQKVRLCFATPLTPVVCSRRSLQIFICNNN